MSGNLDWRARKQKLTLRERLWWLRTGVEHILHRPRGMVIDQEGNETKFKRSLKTIIKESYVVFLYSAIKGYVYINIDVPKLHYVAHSVDKGHLLNIDKNIRTQSSRRAK